MVGIRILVPPARPEANPLLRMIERKGAEIVEFPARQIFFGKEAWVEVRGIVD